MIWRWFRSGLKRTIGRDISNTSDKGAVIPPQLVTTAAPVLALFGATFAIGVAIVLWILHLRVGVFEFEALPIYFSLFVLQDYWPAVVGLVIVALALLRPVQSVAVGVVRVIGNRPYLTSVGALIILTLGARYGYHAHPLSMDEYSPYFQSRVFAAGHLAGRFPAELLDWLVPPGFQNVFLVRLADDGAGCLGLHARLRLAVDPVHGGRRTLALQSGAGCGLAHRATPTRNGAIR